MTDTPAQNVHQAIARVMAEMPAIGKDSRSPQGYQYRGIEAITATIQGLFAKHGVILVPRVVSWAEDQVTINSKPWTQQRLMVEYDVRGPAGLDDVFVLGPIAALGLDNSDKGANKAMTQAYKYALLQLLAIGDGQRDSDSEQPHEPDQAPADWFVEHGWPGGQPEHDAALKVLRKTASDGNLSELLRDEWARINGTKGLTRDQLAELALIIHDATHAAETVDTSDTGRSPRRDGDYPRSDTDPGQPASENQRKAIHAKMRAAKIITPQDKSDWLFATFGREISTSELTAAQAHTAIEALKAIEVAA